MFAMLNQLEGVLGSDALPKQGGDKLDKDEIRMEEPQPNQPTNEQHEENLKIDAQKEGEKLVRKKHDMELDNLLHHHKELEAKEVEARVAKVTLETQKTIFPLWKIEKIQKEAIDGLSILQLEPSIERAPLSDYDVNHMLFSLYFKYRKPQFLTWSFKNIVVVKVYTPIATENFINIKFKGFRGAIRSENEYTLVGLPCMNSYDWFSLFMILSKDE
ncbi:unnamed protein product [Lactuca saligna]|uniref:Uncharacterized protein n=1 Tax=Lactuca saligna TaxID=75948 RepID=A0AA35Z6Q2_LACSI|nr:unnamed protein product [Lactuca saligna]